MINVCLADNYPVVHYGVKSYFRDHPEISVVSNVSNFYMVPDALRNKQIDVLVIDLELEGLKSIYEIKAIINKFPTTKILVFSSLNEQIYAPNAIKAGAAGYVHKSVKLESLGISIVRVHQGLVMLSESLKRNLALISKQNKSERVYRKLSNREVEVLRFLSEGKKNNEISRILDLNEKTISTYKLRLLQKLDVNNIVDLINKAKTLDIV
ncbi:response regulator transcription factor [Flavobacterium croceum]|jgi:DNA-binding NarL/FixJ family response regulator|uniref:LuxR family two component transcriptional regulator n=1 Tax=Flavobacterium croceum DSM 17960 TaxID=1121886 RepID=A0A2S4N6Y1_9FLAO|nr:response regulator transcription factor [Flavobacterium croceum]POS01437.1 LuxR family two component transcriptional regulator [Flavobacterium croceum DSM 17960]